LGHQDSKSSQRAESNTVSATFACLTGIARRLAANFASINNCKISRLARVLLSKRHGKPSHPQFDSDNRLGACGLCIAGSRARAPGDARAIWQRSRGRRPNAWLSKDWYRDFGSDALSSLRAHPVIKLLGRPRSSFRLWLLFVSAVARGQAGPPFLTNDPGTPGSTNWEINLASMQVVTRNASSYQVPQIDLNFGVGDRIQLTYEVPYVLQTSMGQPLQSGWGNGYPGVKWRFLDQGEDEWQMSVFPQVETAASELARQKAIAAAGPRYLLPFEVSKKVGPLDVDFEAGYYVAGHGPKERILGLVAGRAVTDRLELDTELYDDRACDGGSHSTTLDIGGRYKLHRGVIALFMVGRNIKGFAESQPEFMGYLGVQILLSNYGRTLSHEP